MRLCVAERACGCVWLSAHASCARFFLRGAVECVGVRMRVCFVACFQARGERWSCGGAASVSRDTGVRSCVGVRKAARAH
eukprot:2903467-Pleurochrysis_carterae.AAC.1